MALLAIGFEADLGGCLPAGIVNGCQAVNPIPPAEAANGIADDGGLARALVP